MNPNAVKQLIILALCGIAAIVLGVILASEDYQNLILLSFLLLAVYVLAAPGFAPLIAFGLLNPFTLPVPFIYSVPFMFLILGICCVKLFFRNALAREKSGPYRHCLTWGLTLFFGWVFLRYCMHPILPNVAGIGAGVTGFRAYLNYGICFVLVLLLPFFLTSREEVVKLVRWIGGISVFFILFFIPLVFSKSIMAAFWLSRFGLFVSTFDNGWLRFVALPGFGLNVLTLSLFPNLMPLAPWKRVIMAGLGLAAIVLGGNRSSLVMAIIMVLGIMLARRRIMLFSLFLVGTAFLLTAFHLIGERVDVRGGVGFWRLLSLTSRRIAQESGAADTAEWRMVRWKRAMEEVQAHPILGKGYGGLENAWIFADLGQMEQSMIDIALASGSIHNGFLAGAYALGIPAVLLFLIAFTGQILANFGNARRHADADPVGSEVHGFIFANLLALGAWIYTGTDLNGATIWFFLALGVLLTRLGKVESGSAEPIPAQPLPSRALPHRLIA